MSRQSRVPRSDEDDFAPRVVQRRPVVAPAVDSNPKSTSRAPRDERTEKARPISRVPDVDDFLTPASSRDSRPAKVVSDGSRSTTYRKTSSSSNSSNSSNSSKVPNVIEGIVRDVDWKRKPTVLTVAVREHGHFREVEVAVPSDIFCIAKIGDLLKANVREQGRGFYIMNGKPRITIPTDRQSVIETIKRIFPFEYKRGDYKNNDAKLYVAQRIYSTLEQEAKHLEVYELEQFNPVVIYLTDLAQSGDITPLLKLGLEGKQIQSFYQKWITQVSLRNLYCLGLTNEEINRARCFLSRLLIKLTDNPFTIPSIELDKAQEICELIGREVSDSDLTCGKILRILYHNVQKRGWSYTPYDEFNREHPKFKKTLQKHREELEAEHTVPGPDDQPYVVTGYGVKFEEVGLYLREQLNDLEDVVEYVSTLMLKTPDLPVTAAFGQKSTITATPEQQVAIETAVKKPISVITGGPGRGKTTCLTILIEELKKRGRIPIIVSAYGSAVSNAAQRTKTKAYTIHRFIASLRSGRIPPFDHIIVDEASTMSMDLFAMLIEDLKGQRPIFWNKNGRKQYSEDFNFVGEESDPDLDEDPVFDREVKGSESRKSSKKLGNKDRDAMIEKFRKDYPITLTLVGDVDQLPPIAAGNPFESIIRSSFVPTTILTKNLRCEGLTIEANAAKIRDCALEHFEEGDDFEIYDESDDFFEEYLSELKPYLSLDDFQIVTPYNEPLDRINALLQDIYYGDIDGETEPLPRGKNKPKKLFKVGDKIMATSNNYEVEVYNGDTGRVTYIGKVSRKNREWDNLTKSFVIKAEKVLGFRAKFNNTGKEIEFPFFDNRKREVTIESQGFGRHAHERVSTEDLFKNEPTSRIIDHSYAMTGHKCQGNEYKVVIIYLPPTKKPSNFLNHRLLYTMLTRAKLRVVVIGNIRALEQAGRTPMPVRYDELEATLRAILDVQEETDAIEGAERIEGVEVAQLTDGSSEPTKEPSEEPEPEFDEEALMQALENGEELTDEQVMFLARKTMTFNIDDDYGEEDFD